jgi:hypothetical protein
LPDRRSGTQRSSPLGRLLDAINPTFVASSLLVIAAVSRSRTEPGEPASTQRVDDAGSIG